MFIFLFTLYLYLRKKSGCFPLDGYGRRHLSPPCHTHSKLCTALERTAMKMVMKTVMRMVMRVVIIVTVMIWSAGSAALAQVLDQESWTKQDHFLLTTKKQQLEVKVSKYYKNISCTHIFCIYLSLWPGHRSRARVFSKSILNSLSPSWVLASDLILVILVLSKKLSVQEKNLVKSTRTSGRGTKGTWLSGGGGALCRRECWKNAAWWSPGGGRPWGSIFHKVSLVFLLW